MTLPDGALTGQFARELAHDVELKLKLHYLELSMQFAQRLEQLLEQYPEDSLAYRVGEQMASQALEGLFARFRLEEEISMRVCPGTVSTADTPALSGRED